MNCRVCGADNAETHFGGTSCRACAAFFRRYVTSRKAKIVCTCKLKVEKSYPCRHCRMLKCIAIGMAVCKVQSSREKTSKSVFKPGPMAPVSLLSCNIIPRSCSNISYTVDNWADLDQKRKDLYGECFYGLNFLEVSSLAKTDTKLLWSLGELIFPDVKLLSEADKTSLVCNFFPRWIVMESSVDYCTNNEYHRKLNEEDGLEKMIVQFYGSAMPKNNRITDDDIITTFKPYWTHFYKEIAEPVYRMKFDKVDCIAIFLLVLFDDAYTNISEDCAKLCRNLRKVVLRELKGYQMDNNFSESRFINVISSLMLLEKGEEKLQEEVLMCGLNNVSLHDDFRDIMQVKKI